MPLIQCKLGAAQTQVGGNTYTFERDAAGRFVAFVTIPKHVKILTAVAAYEIAAPLDPEGVAPNPAAAPPVDPLVQLRADLAASVAPMLIVVDTGAIIVGAPWPAITALTMDQLMQFAASETPFLVIDPNDRLILTVANGKATYGLKGVLDDQRIYGLLDGSTIDLTTPAGAGPQPPADNDHVAPGATPFPAPAQPAAPEHGLIDVKGIGRGMVARLEDAGITTLAQLAALNAEQAAALDTQIKANGAMARERWVEQAAELLAPKG